MARAKPCLGYPSRTAAIRALMRQGMDTAEIADKTGISRSLVASLKADIRGKDKKDGPGKGRRRRVRKTARKTDRKTPRRNASPAGKSPPPEMALLDMADREGITPEHFSRHMIALGLEVYRDPASGLMGQLANCAPPMIGESE